MTHVIDLSWVQIYYGYYFFIVTSFFNMFTTFAIMVDVILNSHEKTFSCCTYDYHNDL